MGNLTGARRALLVVVAAGLLIVGLPAHASAPTSPACTPAGSPLLVGTVGCRTITTHLLGNGIQAPFAYYVSPSCGSAPCPVLYLLHGFGGDYTEMVGTPSHPSAWVASLTSRPPPGFQSAPWLHADTSHWVAAPPLPMILVAPLGQTLPGGYGPAAGLDSYWVDWNPRYAAGGDSPRYGTPPPRFESFLLDELIPYVTAAFPTGSGRAWRSIGGVSLGGYGAYKDGLRHPDQFSSMLSVSGAMNFLFAPGVDPPRVPLGVGFPVPLPGIALPAVTGLLPVGGLPSQAQSLLTALDALGDPVADQAYFRGNMPRDLAMNGSLGIDGFVNDTIPRRTADLSDPVSIAFEDAVFPMNVDMQLAFADSGIPNTFAVHQGVHSDVYRNAWLRGLEEYAFARMAHPSPMPPSFNYRTVDRSFSIWGWTVTVDRPNVSFLTLRAVSCHAVSLQGSGRVTITVPPSCGTSRAGHTTFTVDLGPSFPVDFGAVPVTGRTVTVRLA